jgi:GTP cyclohydrolase II
MTNFSEIITLQTKFGQFSAFSFIEAEKEHFVLYKNEQNSLNNCLVRIHSECLTGDVFHSLRCDCNSQLQDALEKIAKARAGVLIYLRQEGRGIGLLNKINSYKLQEQGLDTVEANHKLNLPTDCRIYSCVKDVFNKLDVKSIKLITNNPEKVRQLKNIGFEITEIVVSNSKKTAHNEKYLISKKEKMFHTIKL